MEPITKIRLSEQVLNVIKGMIADDGFSPGDKFYSENQLTTKLKVSRSSVREAVRILEATGHVRVEHGRGIFIADMNRERFGAFTDWLKENEQSIIEHFEVRLMIDPKAAAYAAGKAEDKDIRQLEQACENFENTIKDNNTAGLIKCDEEFHRILAKSTQNKTLYFLMKSMTQSLPEGWISSLHTPGRIDKTIGEHRAIVDAIRNRNPKSAERAMTVHLNNALRDIRSTMPEQAGI